MNWHSRYFTLRSLNCSRFMPQAIQTVCCNYARAVNLCNTAAIHYLLSVKDNALLLNVSDKHGVAIYLNSENIVACVCLVRGDSQTGDNLFVIVGTDTFEYLSLIKISLRHLQLDYDTVVEYERCTDVKVEDAGLAVAVYLSEVEDYLTAI